MVRILCIGDPHFKTSNILETRMMVDKILEVIDQHNVDFVVNLGDTLHTHEKAHVEPFTEACTAMKRISEKRHLYMLIGNHDRPNNSDFLSDKHFFTPLKHWNNITIVDKVLGREIHGHNFVFVPYVPNGMFEQALCQSDLGKTRAIFAHQEFKGAKMGGIISVNGDNWPESHPLVISGHVHNYQKPQDNIIYTGTPMSHAFGDTDEKTVSLFHFEGDNYTETRINLGLPRRYIVYLTADQIEGYVHNQNDLVKIVIRATEPEIRSLSSSLKIKTLESKGIKISYKTLSSRARVLEEGEMIQKQYIPFLVDLRNYIGTDTGQLEAYNYIFS